MFSGVTCYKVLEHGDRGEGVENLSLRLIYKKRA
jgi:hypothetical protein